VKAYHAHIETISHLKIMEQARQRKALAKKQLARTVAKTLSLSQTGSKLATVTATTAQQKKRLSGAARRKKRSVKAWAENKLTLLTGKQIPPPLQKELEVGDTEVMQRPLPSELKGALTDCIGQGTLEEEELMLASGSGEAAVEAELAPSHSAERETRATVGTAAGQKRKIKDGYTPPQILSKRTRGVPLLGTTFEEAERQNLLGVLIVQDNPYTMLNKPQLDHVRADLLTRLHATIALHDSNVPQFHESGVVRGMFHFSCANELSYQWLKTEVADITVSSEEDETVRYQLELVDSASLPIRKLLRAEVHLWKPTPALPAFRKLLQAQNAGIHVDRWVLRHHQSTDAGMFIVWFIDQESADALSAVDDRPYFGLGRVTFTVFRESNPDGISLQ